MPLIGFMQGRLSPLIDGKIQSFPWPYWREEFAAAEKHGFPLMEWTLDLERLYENPLMTREGRREIQHLMGRHGVAIPSLTGDCFMQAPFYKVTGKARERLLDDFKQVLESSAALGMRMVVLPLVDNGRLDTPVQEESLLTGLEKIPPILKDAQMQVGFESDFPPADLAAFIRKFDSRYFGINYDIGNSASLGYNLQEEINAYGPRIVGVHVKDRTLNGGTVPLGEGDANIPLTLRAISQAGYGGNFILQTARAADGDHAGALCRYRDLVAGWLREIEANGPAA